MSHTPSSTAGPGGAARRHVRGSTLLLAGRGVGVLVNFCAQVLIVRHLPMAEYGAFAFALAFAAVGTHAVGLGLDKGANRFIPIFEERRQYDQMAGTIAFVLGLTLAFGVVLLGLVFALQGALAGLAPDPLTLSLLLVLACLAPVQALDNLMVKLFAIFASPRALFVRRHVLTPGLRLAAVLALILSGGDARFLAIAWVATTLIGVAISVAIIWGLLRERGLTRYFRRGQIAIPARQVLRFSVPLISSDVVTSLRGNLVALLLGLFHAASTVAAFRAVFPVARLNMVVFDSFKLLYVPAAARMYAREDWAGINELYWKAACWIVALTFPIFAVSCSLAQPLAVMLFGESYAGSGPLLSLLAIGYFVNAAFGFNALTLRVLGRVRALVAIDAITIAIALLANLILIPSHGALGGAIASCGALVAQNALAQLVLLRTGAVRGLDRGFLRVAAGAGVGAGAVFAVQAVLDGPILLGVAVAALAGVLVVTLNARSLELGTNFPELERIRLLRWLLRVRSGSDAESESGTGDESGRDHTNPDPIAQRAGR